MTPRTLWTIILKIFGIYLVLQIYYPLMQLISLILMVINHQFGDHVPPIGTLVSNQFDGGIQEIGFVFFSISIYLFMVIAFLFRTGWLIDLLKLDRSVKEEKLELRIHRSTVLTITVLLSGILLFVDSLPQFLKEFYGYYQYQKMTELGRFTDYPRTSFIIVQLAKLFISILLVGANRPVVNFIERKRRGPKAVVAAPDEQN
ncbi:MAG TPA: hypothetical protein VFE53_23065 [Mucilaginibacter sp.]|jgi:hypothetical protein|nr:hypothetical protein [Mucilaginibacter sp.]